MSNRVAKILYWVLTLPFCFMMVMSASMYFSHNPEVLAGIKQTGFPLFFLYILGTAKILGAIAIVLGFFKTLKEWAYAGFTFTMLGAAATHCFLGDPASKVMMPLVFLAVLMGSYALWKRELCNKA